jgi:6-phosphogluconolactonase
MSIAAKMEAEGVRTMRRWAGQGLAAVGIWALCLTTGCNGFFVSPGSTGGGGGGGGGGSSTANYVYVANAARQSLAAFAVGTGTLTAVSGSPFALGFVPTAVVVNPANTIVYVAGGSGQANFINAYAIGTAGVLSLVATNAVTSAEFSIDISQDGQWLMGLNPIGASTSQAIVDEYQIVNTSGQLQLVSNAGGVFNYLQSTNTPPIVRPWNIKFSPNGQYVFAAMGTGGDVVFPFNTLNGAFSVPLWLQPAVSTSDQALAVSSDSLRLYIARSGISGGLAVYTIGAGGALNAVPGSPFTAGNRLTSVVINKAGTNVYVANQGDSTISGYSVAGGTVTILNPATTTTASAPTALAIDNSGSYLLSASYNGSPDLSMYSYDATTAGELDPVTTMATGVNPTGPVAIATTH